MDREGLKQVPTPVRLERVWVTCPGCGQQVEAVARDGVIRGWCSISRQRVNFPIEMGKNPTAETSPVDDYLAGNKVIVIQDRYGISPGTLYRVLRAANVRLRTDEGDASGGGIKCPKEV